MWALYDCVICKFFQKWKSEWNGFYRFGIKLGRENVGSIGPFIGNDMRKTFIFIEIILFVISVKVDLG